MEMILRYSRTAQPTWRRCLAGLFFLLAVPLAAQTVIPLIDENVVGGPHKKATGRIEYVNNSLQTLAVTLDTQSFTVSDKGVLTYRPLDPNIHLKLSSTSFRIPPKQKYLVFYEASADEVPAWFAVYATFAGFKERTAEGMQIHVLLPHTIYLLPKGNARKDELVVRQAQYDSAAKVVHVAVENLGAVFTRVTGVEVSRGQDRATNNGFPVFPHSARQVDIAWSAKDAPRKTTLHFQDFQLEQAITTSP